MSEYDRFHMAGGLDSSTPYIGRTPGSLLLSRNFSPDSDGGYRLRGGFERYDGRLSPSATTLKSLHVTGSTAAFICGQTVTGSISGAKGVIGKVMSDQLWVDVQTSTSFVTGDAFGGVTVEFVTDEPVASNSFIPDTGEEIRILIVTPDVGFNPAVGAKVRGNLSGATARVNFILTTTTNRWLYVSVLEGEIMSGETISDVDGDTATVTKADSVEPMLSTPNTQAGTWYFLSELRRAAIGQVPGTGNILSVWELNNVVYAFRNGAMYASSPAGWVNVPLGFTLKWNNRPTSITDDELGPGDIVRGATSNATATVGWVGYSAQDHSAGYITFVTNTGTFVDGEDLQNTSLANIVIGKVSGTRTANTLPTTANMMRFVNHNFFGGSDTMAMYGVTGNSTGFAYSPALGFGPILTGATVDTPYDVIVHKDHLFYAYPHGSLQHSVVGSPFDWSGGLGALEVGVGSEIRGLISSPKSLIICTEKDVQSLSGNGVDDWEKDIVTSHNGIAPFSGQYQSQSFVLTRTGVVAVDRTDQFGNFSDNTVSDKIRNLIRPKYDKCVTAVARKDDGIYYLYFNDGTNIGMASYQGQLTGFFTFEHAGLITRGAVAPYGRLWFYSSTGYIYQDDIGWSADGNEKVAAIRTSYANQGDPDTRKRFRRADITFSASTYVNVLVNFTFDKGASDSLSSIDSGLISANGGRWDASNWNQVFWDAAEFPSVATEIDGVGFDISTMVYLSSRIHPEFVVEDISLEWSKRRKVR